MWQASRADSLAQEQKLWIQWGVHSTFYIPSFYWSSKHLISHGVKTLPSQSLHKKRTNQHTKCFFPRDSLFSFSLRPCCKNPCSFTQQIFPFTIMFASRLTRSTQPSRQTALLLSRIICEVKCRAGSTMVWLSTLVSATTSIFPTTWPMCPVGTVSGIIAIWTSRFHKNIVNSWDREWKRRLKTASCVPKPPATTAACWHAISTAVASCAVVAVSSNISHLQSVQFLRTWIRRWLSRYRFLLLCGYRRMMLLAAWETLGGLTSRSISFN